jgi:hypothetical protein
MKGLACRVLQGVAAIVWRTFSKDFFEKLDGLAIMIHHCMILAPRKILWQFPWTLANFSESLKARMSAQHLTHTPPSLFRSSLSCFTCGV